ncbi:MAG: sigma-70 family RNA polymerase sigma factor [Planctomycetota bacterium]
MISPHETQKHDVDEQFRRFCRDDDKAALATVFSTVAPWLTRRAMQIVRDPMLAMDLVQATFVTAIEVRDRFDGSAKARPWLRGILENKARRRSTSSTRTELLTEEPVADHNPAELVMQNELRVLVHEAIQRLPEPYCGVLRRALLHDETAEQIAAALERPPATVRSQVQRGLARLRLTLPATFGALLRAFRSLSRNAAITAVATGTLLILAIVATWATSRTQAPDAAGSTVSVSASATPYSALLQGAVAPLEIERTAAQTTAKPTEGRVAPQPKLAIQLARIDDVPLPGVAFAMVWPGSIRQVVTTDEAGVAHLGRALGNSVIVEAPFAGLRREFELPAGLEANGGTLPIRVAPGFSLAGEIVDASGQPVASARVLRADDAGELQVATSDAEGRFLVVDLLSSQPHRLRAVLGAKASAEARLVGAIGTTLTQCFQLDRDRKPAALTPAPGAEAVDSARPLTIDFHCVDGAVVHGWLAVLSKTTAQEVVAMRPIVGSVATFPAVPMTGLRCTLMPPATNASTLANTDAQVLARRHGTASRRLVRDGDRAIFEVRSDELPSAWLRMTATRGKPRIAERAALLDRRGRPHGIFLDIGEGIGPIRSGTWTIALVAGGREIEYRGPFEVLTGGVYAIDDMAGQPSAVLQLRGANRSVMEPPLERLWLCAADVIMTLEPRRDIHADLRVAPGDYVLFWQQRGRACASLPIRAKPGVQPIELVAPVGVDVALAFDYGHLDDAAASTSGRVAQIDLTVRDASGATYWRERLHAPTDVHGRLRAMRRFACGEASIEAVDASGAHGTARWQEGDEAVRVVMRPPDRSR